MMMNRNILFSLLCFGISIGAGAQENQINVHSKINAVTVFMNGAQVERLSDLLDLPQGVSLLVFSGLSSSIETQSLQAKGEGSFTILSVNKQNNFLMEKKKSEQKEALQARLVDIVDKITALRNEVAVYKAEEEMLMKNQTVMGPNVSYDLVKLKAALDFQRQRLIDAKTRQTSLGKDIDKWNAELVKIGKQVADVDGKAIGQSNDVVVKISAKTATKGKFMLTYLVKNASWYPTYDIRAKDVTSPIQLIYKANVSQNSGEEWKNVKLTLSSGNPSNNNEKPTLPIYQLGFLSAGYSFFNPVSASLNAVKGKVLSASDNLALPGVSIRVKNSSIATVTDGEGNYSIQLPPGANTLVFSSIGFENQELLASHGQLNVSLREDTKNLSEVVVMGYAGINEALAGKVAGAKVRGASSVSTVPLQVKNVERQTNITFEIKMPYTILSDGKQATVDIGNYDFKADYEYYTVPKVTQDAFLTAKITDFNEVNLISGEASIFFEGTYLGKSLLDIGNITDTLTLSLGADKNVVVKREKQKDFNERQFIGSSQKDTRHFVIDIKNRKNQKVNLIVEDQLPVSTSSDISIEKQDISKAKLEEATGKLIWKMELEPNEQKKIDLKYQVKHPKNKPINME
ncbi:mucoidy inhibitor MuiA family protein [Pedobacter sp. ASV28]|uniref:mucoidy inhibitor MuiA family protein n=1 Tax=Pedobacter sp. ASV28 TaxID=2795123 RepID=UPI0018EC5026|nr:mucoidy inhibitor MuiA family protein [Pedobacter sp. ASV28]